MEPTPPNISIDRTPMGTIVFASSMAIGTIKYECRGKQGWQYFHHYSDEGFSTERQAAEDLIYTVQKAGILLQWKTSQPIRATSF